MSADQKDDDIGAQFIANVTAYLAKLDRDIADREARERDEQPDTGTSLPQ